MTTSAPQPESASRRARRRARDEVVGEIVEAGRRQLATEGAAALSLRAVARELGMVSSAVYRYVAGRDELLTLLITAAYDSLGEYAERAEAKVAREDLRGRFLAAGQAFRRWALRHPHEYALIFGSPVPGYAAPETTIAPAARVPILLITILAEHVARRGERCGGPPCSTASAPVDPVIRRALAPVRRGVPDEIPDELFVRGLMSWTYLIGAVTAELFGHRHNVVADTAGARDAFFVVEMQRMTDFVLID
jgi:AcrR family transcriptional regulator